MKNTPLLLAIIFCLLSVSISAQFYNNFKDVNVTERATAAITLGNNFVFGYTETNGQQHFHENILLIKTNTAGNFVWSKKYDAGTGISLRLVNMISASGNQIVISCIITPDNNFNNEQRCLLKLNSNGAVLWCKKYTGGNPYDDEGLAQLKDSSFVVSTLSGAADPAILQIDNTGKIINAVKITNRQFAPIHSITATGNTADIIINNSNRVSINFKTKSVTGQQQYNTSNQFVALLSERCKNGDIIYLAGRTQGGILSGTSRIFRTTAGGSLVWAKNINAYFNTSGLPFSVFDIVQQVSVHEDINGNILACVMEESTQELIIAFDATGKYLYNRVLSAPLSFIAETANGTYLNAAPPSNNFFGNVVFADRFLSATSSCDSSIIVNVTNGTDSSATLDKIIFVPATFTTTDVSVTVQNTTLQQTVFCSNTIAATKENINKDIQLKILPNPASNSIIIQCTYNLPCRIYDMQGSLKITSSSNKIIDITTLHAGIYIVAVLTKDAVEQKAFIKQ